MRAMQLSRPRRGGFGSPRDHEPAWIENWNKNTRQGKDSLDWFFRAFNHTGIYEVFLKSSPRFYGFMVMVASLVDITGAACGTTIGLTSTRGRSIKTARTSTHLKMKMIEEQ